MKSFENKTYYTIIRVPDRFYYPETTRDSALNWLEDSIDVEDRYLYKIQKWVPSNCGHDSLWIKSVERFIYQEYDKL